MGPDLDFWTNAPIFFHFIFLFFFPPFILFEGVELVHERVVGVKVAVVASSKQQCFSSVPSRVVSSYIVAR